MLTSLELTTLKTTVENSKKKLTVKQVLQLLTDNYTSSDQVGPKNVLKDAFKGSRNPEGYTTTIHPDKVKSDEAKRFVKVRTKAESEKGDANKRTAKVV